LQLDLWELLMRLTSIGLIAAATIGIAGIALSADLPVKAPAYAPPVAAPYNWTGSYVGGNIGYGWGSGSIELTPFTVFPAVPFSL
jgi:outer membrane immunogenic protein